MRRIAQPTPVALWAGLLCSLLCCFALMAARTYAQQQPQSPEADLRDPTMPDPELAAELEESEASAPAEGSGASTDRRTRTASPNLAQLDPVVRGRLLVSGRTPLALLEVGGRVQLIRQGGTIHVAVDERSVRLRARRIDERGVNLEIAEERQPDEARPDGPQADEARPEDDTSAEKTPRLRLLALEGVPLALALRMLNEQTGLNAVASRQAADRPITLFLKSIPALAALEAMCEAHELWFRRQEQTGVIRLATLAEYRGDLSRFGPERTRVFTLLYPRPIDVARAIRNLYGQRVLLSEERGRDEQWVEDIEQRFDRFELLNERSQGQGLGVGGGRAGGTARTAVGTDNRRTTDRADDTTGGRARTAGGPRLREEDLDTPRTWPIYLSVMRRNNALLVRTADDAVMQQIAELIQRLDVPTPLLLLQVKVLSIDLMDSLDSSLSYGFEVGDFRGGFRSGDIGNPIEAGVFEVVGGNFQARLQLLQQENRVTELLSPLLLTAHEEVSRIFVGETVPIVTDFTPGSVVAGEGDPIVVPPIPNTELQDIGTELLITPRINADRTVTLRLLQQSSVRQEGAATIPVPITDGGGTAIVDQPIDTVQRQTVTTTLVAKDGETVAVAGLIREGQTDNKAQIPLLGDIPLLGVLFRSQRTARTRDEVVVLIRPFVLNTPSDAVSRGRQLLREMSLHPMAQDPEGTLRTFGPREVPDRGIGRKLHARFRFLGYEQPNDAGTEGKR